MHLKYHTCITGVSKLAMYGSEDYITCLTCVLMVRNKQDFHKL